MNTSLECNLRKRALLLKQARAFFEERDVLEVDCPALSPAAPLDLHIDVMKVLNPDGSTGYLHTSPEYGMKRLLAAGSGDIYQISHVFREGEVGPLHNPEFMMAEWYRIGFSLEQMIEETLAFIALFFPEPLPIVQMSYRQLLQHFLSIDYLTVTPADLIACAKQHSLDVPPDAVTWDRDTLLQMLISFLIEPQLGQDDLFVLTDFPASQAALSQTTRLDTGEVIAQRFEVYAQGMELANGYGELTDPVEQRRRFEKTNEARQRAGKDVLKIDEPFLRALEQGLPDCCGVAVGFDRLVLLNSGEKTLQNILPFHWNNA